MIAPRTITLEWCPVCGRHDRYQPFTGKSHYKAGDKCSGQPISVAYVRTPDGLPSKDKP